MPADGERLIVALRWNWYSFTQPVMSQITGKWDLYCICKNTHTYTHNITRKNKQKRWRYGWMDGGCTLQQKHFFICVCVYLIVFLLFLLTAVWTARVKAKQSVCLAINVELFTNSFAKHVWTLLSVNTRSILWEESVFYHGYCPHWKMTEGAGNEHHLLTINLFRKVHVSGWNLKLNWVQMSLLFCALCYQQAFVFHLSVSRIIITFFWMLVGWWGRCMDQGGTRQSPDLPP